MKLKSFFLAFCMIAFRAVMAQGDIDQLIKGSLADANLLVKGYITPAFNTLGNGLNQGWYNTAKSHKTLGFDLTITASGISYPASDLTYAVSNSQLQKLACTAYPPSGPPYTSASSINAPTIFGSDVAPVYQVLDAQKQPTGQYITSAPGTNLGKDLSFIPVPMVQLGIGLPKGTDLKVRFFPSTKIGNNGNVNMLGFAIMHDIKQYIPRVKSLPFDLSILVGYTKLKVHAGLSDTNPDQQSDFSTSATTVQGLISKKFSVLTLYGGVGYNFISNNLGVSGRYYLDNTNTNYVDNPINLSNSQSGPRITGGLRLKFAIFTLHGDYTLQKYSAFTVGFGFNVR